MKTGWQREIPVLIFVFIVISAAQSQTSSCERLKGLSLEKAQVTAAEVVDPRTANIVDTVPPAMAPLFKSLPEFCRVRAEANPSSDSDIKIEVWMPAAGWNGKF